MSSKPKARRTRRAVSQPTPYRRRASVDDSRLGVLRIDDLEAGYICGETIGSGFFAKVKVAQHRLTGQNVAIKHIDKIKLHNRNELFRAKNEVEALKTLNHPNVLSVYQIIESSSRVSIVTEYIAGGDLFDLIIACGYIKEQTDAAFMFGQICDAVSYCHDQGIAHRDIKPENILVDDLYRIKLIDFGLLGWHVSQVLTTPCGSINYAAPEVLRGQSYEGAVADIWSLGIVLYTMLVGYLPFDSKNHNILTELILEGNYKLPARLQGDVVSLLSSILIVESSLRASLDDILNHKWVKAGYCRPMSDAPLQPRSNQPLNEEILLKLSKCYDTPVEAMRTLVSRWNYDHTTADYLLMLDVLESSADNLICFPTVHDGLHPLHPHQPYHASPSTSTSSLTEIAQLDGEYDEDLHQHTLTPNSSLHASCSSIQELGINDSQSTDSSGQSSISATATPKTRRRRLSVSLHRRQPRSGSTSRDDIDCLSPSELPSFMSVDNLSAISTPKSGSSTPGSVRGFFSKVRARFRSKKLLQEPPLVNDRRRLNFISPATEKETTAAISSTLSTWSDTQVRQRGFRSEVSVISEITDSKEVRFLVEVCYFQTQDQVGVRTSRVRGNAKAYMAVIKLFLEQLEGQFTF